MTDETFPPRISAAEQAKALEEGASVVAEEGWTYEKWKAWMEERCKAHGPENWRDEVPNVVDTLLNDEPHNMIVVAADIRHSTALMKETINFREFAKVLTRFISLSNDIIRNEGGWFDKFLGDGFLAYWLIKPEEVESFEDQIEHVLIFCHSALQFFHTRTLPELRPNLRNLPVGAGLSIGIDGGPTHFVDVAEELSILGPAVVGAVRMVSAATTAGEVLCNVGVGDPLHRARVAKPNNSYSVGRVYRKTKEYERQEMYRVRFPKVEEAVRALGIVVED